MKNTIVNEKKAGNYFWWAHSAPIDALTRKRKEASLPPRTIGTLHMLRDSAACLHVADLVNGRYNYGGILYNMPPDIYQIQKSRFSQLSVLSHNDLILHISLLQDHEAFSYSRFEPNHFAVLFA